MNRTLRSHRYLTLLLPSSSSSYTSRIVNFDLRSQIRIATTPNTDLTIFRTCSGLVKVFEKKYKIRIDKPTIFSKSKKSHSSCCATTEPINGHNNNRTSVLTFKSRSGGCISESNRVEVICRRLFTSQRLSGEGEDNSDTNRPENMPDFVVGHDSNEQMFYITLQAKSSQNAAALAKLEYEWLRPNLVDLYHTEVPEEFQGHGIAKLLAKAAFDHFCEKDVKFRPTCTYLQKYLRENPIARYLDSMDKTM